MTQSPPSGGWSDPTSTPQGEHQPTPPGTYPQPQAAAPAPAGWADPAQPTVLGSGPPPQPVVPGAAYGTPAAAPPGFNYGYGYGYPVPGPKTNGLSIASMVVAIVGMLGLSCYGFGGLIGAVGAILGHVARRQIRERGESGDGMALAGVIVGWIATALGVLILGTIAVFIIIAINAESSV